MSGKEASFLSGGEVPIVQTLADSSTVQYKEFGVRLHIKPVVDSENNITSHLLTEASQANFDQTAAGQPTFIIRRAETDVQVKDGQTIVIGGLLKNETGNIIRKVPWMGDIPVLGVLFRSKDYQQSLSELLVFVTLDVLKDAAADVANAAQTPEMKIWNGKQADEELRQQPKPDPNWQKPLDVDELSVPPAPSVSPKASPAAATTGPEKAKPVANFNAGQPAGK
jgi:pilus assembly protein CpaC